MDALKNCVHTWAAQLLRQSLLSLLLTGYEASLSVELFPFAFLFFFLLPVHVKEFPSVHGQAWTGSAPEINYIGVRSFLL